MRIAIMQPTYLPWLGYLELMASCDLFIYFDDVQFVKKSWQQKNRIKSFSGELTLTVPVLTSGKRFQNINEAEINNTEAWKKKHLASIEVNYKKARFYDQYINEVRGIYAQNHTRLADLNEDFVDFFRRHFNIFTPCTLASELRVSHGENRNEYIVNLCRLVSANVLYDAAGAASILDLEYFKNQGITLEFQDYKPVSYNQLYPPFIPYLSALDCLFNEGDKALNVLLQGVKK